MTEARAIDRRPEIVLGLSCLFSYALHGWHYVERQQAANLLWFCHLGALAVGLGLILRSSTPNAVGLLWLCIGTPCWLLDLFSGGEVVVGSVLTHVVGLAAGVFGLRRLGLPPGAWWKALAALAAVYAVTRAVTPRAENVNLAFAVWPGWETWFPSYVAYIAFLVSVAAAVFLAVCWAVRASGFAPTVIER